MISRRYFLHGMVLTVTGLMIPEVVGKVFYSIPKVVVPQNLIVTFDSLLKEYYPPILTDLLNRDTGMMELMRIT